MTTGTTQRHELHKQHLLAQAEEARGAEWVAAHRRLLDEQIEMLAGEGVVLTDEEFEAAQQDGRDLATLTL